MPKKRFSTFIKQSSANQLKFPLFLDPSDYDFITFGFYQNGQCIAMYNSYDTEYVNLDEEGEVTIYMLASVAKKFGPQRVSYEVTTWKDSTSEHVVRCSVTLSVVPSNDRSSIVDTDDSEVTDTRLKANIERMIGEHVELNVNAAIDIDENGYLYVTQVGGDNQ